METGFKHDWSKLTSERKTLINFHSSIRVYCDLFMNS